MKHLLEYRSYTAKNTEYTLFLLYLDVDVLRWTDPMTSAAQETLDSMYFDLRSFSLKGAAASRGGGVFPLTPLPHLLSGPPSRPKPIHLCLCSPTALQNGTQSTQNQSRSLQLTWGILARLRPALKLLRPDGQRTIGEDGPA